MTLSFKIFGYEVASLDLEMAQDEPAVPTTAKVVEKGVGIVSDWWLDRLFKRSKR